MIRPTVTLPPGTCGLPAPATNSRGQELMAELQALRGQRRAKKHRTVQLRQRDAVVGRAIRAMAEQILAGLPADPDAGRHLLELDRACRPGSAEYARWRATAYGKADS